MAKGSKSAATRHTKPVNSKVGGNQKAIGKGSSSKVNSDVIRAGSKPSKASSDPRKNFTRSGTSKHL